jgi:hypothetical protein
MAVEWTASADKHGIPREDALYAIANAVGSEEVHGLSGEVTTVYVGHPHPHTARHIEVIAAAIPPRRLRIFHVSELTDHYRHLVPEEDP